MIPCNTLNGKLDFNNLSFNINGCSNFHEHGILTYNQMFFKSYHFHFDTYDERFQKLPSQYNEKMVTDTKSPSSVEMYIFLYDL